jgi:hypothetical protein
VSNYDRCCKEGERFVRSRAVEADVGGAAGLVNSSNPGPIRKSNVLKSSGH